MKTFDIINALFEVFGAYLAWVNFFRLRRDQEVKGTYWPTWAFFTGWGMWNLIFYPFVGAWLSAAAGAFLCAGNLAWTIQAWRIVENGDFESAGPAIDPALVVPARAGSGTGPYILRTQAAQKPDFGADTTEIDHDVVMREVFRFPQRDELRAKIEHERNKFKAVDLYKDENDLYSEDEPTTVWLNDGDLIEEK